MTRSKDYGPDILSDTPRRRAARALPEVAADRDLVVECASTGFCGAVVAVEKDAVVLEDRHGTRRSFALTAGAFLLDGEPVTLVRPTVASASGPLRSASGSVAVTGLRARVARAGRIYVEGRHDAELVEK